MKKHKSLNYKKVMKMSGNMEHCLCPVAGTLNIAKGIQKIK
jgi:hypothetical protein